MSPCLSLIGPRHRRGLDPIELVERASDVGERALEIEAGVEACIVESNFRNLTGGVLSVEGEANPKTSTFGDANQEGMDTMFRVRVGAINFPVQGPSQVNAFEKGKRYRAYYLKSTIPVLVSAERLD